MTRIFVRARQVEIMRPDRLRRRRLLGLSILLGCLTVFATAAVAEHHSNPWLLSWIPTPCCVTNDCCWEVSESELRPIDGEHWEVLATSQIVERTDWTPDGKFYRCACDFSGGKWIRHQGAYTRCIFVPLRTTGF